jgi:hypothetical protein
MIIVVLMEKPKNIDKYFRALAGAVFLFKAAYDIYHLLSRWVI